MVTARLVTCHLIFFLLVMYIYDFLYRETALLLCFKGKLRSFLLICFFLFVLNKIPQQKSLDGKSPV